MRIQSKALLFLAFILLLPAFAVSSEVKVHLIVTSDIHARVFPYDFVSDRPMQASMAHVHTLVSIARARQGSNVILLDNGDLIQGTPAGYYANFVQQARQNLFSRVLNLMQYDAATVGNHDIEAGPEVYNRLIKEFDFPYLGANVINNETGKPFFKPYTIIERQGVRIAVLGLTTPAVPTWLPEKLWKGMSFQEIADAARHWVQIIEQTERPDAIVGLFHSGLGVANPDPNQRFLENASLYVAQTVPGFDVVFIGHDHREWLKTVQNSKGEEVLLVGPGPFAEKIGVVELTFFRNSDRSFVLTNTKAELIPATTIPPSPEFFTQFENDVSEIVAFSNEPAGRLNGELVSNDAFFGSAPFVDIVHDLQLKITGADISFTAPLSFNQTIRSGIMRVRDFFNLYRFENYLYVMELTGAEILNYLEFSYSLWLNQMAGPEDHLLLFREDGDGRPLAGPQGRFRLDNPSFNFDSAAGIEYTVDVSKPVGQRININGMEDGTPFDPAKTYRVAINSYRGSGGGDHLTAGAGIPHEKLRERIVFTSEKDLRSEMIKYFREKKEVSAKARNNWRIIPESWVEAARERDLKKLLP